MTFYKGGYTPVTFYYDEQAVENVNSFTYLGVVFSTRLSAHKHVLHVVSKCNTRTGYLFSKLPLVIVIDIFNIYVLPIATYCSPTWLPLLKSNADRNRINALFTKFLKRYLGIPYGSRNAIVHFLTNTIPMFNILERKAHNLQWKVNYPPSIEGTRFEPPDISPEYLSYREIPSYFWASEILKKNLPTNPEARRALLYDTQWIYIIGISVYLQTWWDIQKICAVADFVEISHTINNSVTAQF